MARRAPADPDEMQMSFGEHLEELRRRLIYALCGVGAVSLATLWYGRTIALWLFQPLIEVQRVFDLPAHLVPHSVLTGLGVYVKVSLLTGLIVGAPWVVYQLWKFVETGLYAHERRVVVLLTPLSALMTTISVLFTYYLLLPATLTFLMFFTISYPQPDPAQRTTVRAVSGYLSRVNDLMFSLLPGTFRPAPKTATTRPADTQPGPGDVGASRVPVFDADPAKPEPGQLWFNRERNELRLFDGDHVRTFAVATTSLMVPLIDPNDYLSLVLFMALVDAAIFQVPVIMAFLGRTGLIDPAWVARYRKQFVWGCFVVVVFFTPSQDIVTNLVLPLVMWGLFEFGLVLMRWNYTAPDPDADAID